MSESFQVEKWVWTEADFEKMRWHDSQIHAIAFSPEKFEIVLDIDYILQWIHPKQNETYYKFWVSPATLVFKNVCEVNFDIGSYTCGLEIDSIKREDARRPRNTDHIRKYQEWLWTIECQEGQITFRSAGYKQYIRTFPIFSGSQTLPIGTRGFSFERMRTDV